MSSYEENVNVSKGEWLKSNFEAKIDKMATRRENVEMVVRGGVMLIMEFDG